MTTLANHNNCTENHGSPKLVQSRKDVPISNCAPSIIKPPTSTYAKTLVQCQLTAKQLNHQEVEELWKNTALRQIAKILSLPNLIGLLDSSEIIGDIPNILYGCMYNLVFFLFIVSVTQENGFYGMHPMLE